MSARRPFLADLRRLEPELPVPLPTRIRILRELEYDLEELRAGLQARGLEPDEARRRAREALLPDSMTLTELGRLHMPLYRRVTRSLGAERVRIVERSALALATATVLLAETVALLRADLLDDPSPFLWPVLALGALLIAACGAKAFELWVKRDHRSPERGLGGILALTGVVLASGLVGVAIDVYRLAGVLEGAPALAGTLGPEWLVRDCALLSVSILLSLGGGLAWSVLSGWVSLVAGARHEALGLDRRPHPTEEERP